LRLKELDEDNVLILATEWLLRLLAFVLLALFAVLFLLAPLFNVLAIGRDVVLLVVIVFLLGVLVAELREVLALSKRGRVGSLVKELSNGDLVLVDKVAHGCVV